MVWFWLWGLTFQFDKSESNAFGSSKNWLTKQIKLSVMRYKAHNVLRLTYWDSSSHSERPFAAPINTHNAQPNLLCYVQFPWFCWCSIWSPISMTICQLWQRFRLERAPPPIRAKCDDFGCQSAMGYKWIMCWIHGKLCATSLSSGAASNTLYLDNVFVHTSGFIDHLGHSWSRICVLHNIRWW